MKLLTLVSAAGALLLLPQTVLAAPIIEARTTTTTTSVASAIRSTDINSSGADSESSGKSPTSVGVAVDPGAPQCERAYADLCLANNVGARCDGSGAFHNSIEKMCNGHCWCGH